MVLLPPRTEMSSILYAGHEICFMPRSKQKLWKTLFAEGSLKRKKGKCIEISIILSLLSFNMSIKNTILLIMIHLFYFHKELALNYKHSTQLMPNICFTFVYIHCSNLVTVLVSARL